MARYRRCAIGLEIQTLLFDKGLFSRSAARRWAAERGFSQKKVDETANTYRLRQRPPGAFVKGSFRTIELGESGVKAVVACPRKSHGGESL